MFRALPTFRALAPALLLAAPALLAPLSAAPALAEGIPGNAPVVLAQEAPPTPPPAARKAQDAPPTPPPAARKHDCERQEEGVS